MMTKYFKHILQAVLVCCCLTAPLTSCDNVVETDDDDYVSQHAVANSGAPTISAVYTLTDTEQQTPITEAAPGQRLLIVGENLNNLQSLKFNTVEADLSQTFTALTKAVVKVPDGFSKAHENTIVYTTDQGTATYRFSVTLPEAEVYGLLNEFSEAGTDVSVDGKNLKYYDFTLTLAGSQLPLTVADDKLSFRIPEGTPDNSMFVISWQTVKGESRQVNLSFRPTDSMLFADITKATRQQTDRHVTIETDKQGLSCLHFQGLITEWSWVELSFSQSYSEICDAAAVSQYNFVFEVQTATGKPLLENGYEFAWNWDWDNSCRWNPGDGFDTQGQWQTVRLPLEQMAPNGLGTAGSDMTLNIGFQPYRDYDADFRLANFRIVKK